MGKVKDMYVAVVERVAADCADGSTPRMIRARLAWELRGVVDIDDYMVADVVSEMEHRLPGSTAWMAHRCEVIAAETGARCEGIATRGARCALHGEGGTFRHGSALRVGDVTRDDVPVRVVSNVWDDHSETGQLIVESGAGWRYPVRYGWRSVYPMLRWSTEQWRAHVES